MKKILVLGATGNVGSYFTKYAFEYFRGDEYQIVASGKRPIANVFKTMGIEYISADITKQEDIQKFACSCNSSVYGRLSSSRIY